MFLKHSVPVKVTEDFINKVKYLCNRIPDEEWSGVLYYDINGTVKDITNFSIVLKDICPMHKGNSVHTDFEYGEDVIDYQMSNPVLNITPKGLIHSHNKMGVFFSNEDQSEIEDNAEFYNYYLSVVVNNRLDFAMRLSFLGEISLTAKDEKGQIYNTETSEKFLFVYPCHLQLDTVNIPVEEIFSKQVDKIIADHKIAQARIPKTPITQHGNKATLTAAEYHKKISGQEFIPPHVNNSDDNSDDSADLEDFLMELFLADFPEIVTDEIVTLDETLLFIEQQFTSKTLSLRQFLSDISRRFFHTHFTTYGEVSSADIKEDFNTIEKILMEYVPYYGFVDQIIDGLNRLLFNYTLLEADEQQ